MRTTMSDVDRSAFAPSEKIAIVATLSEQGEPHVSLLTSLMATGESSLTIGEFSRGLSKRNMAARPAVGFLVMGLDRRLWRGKALWRRLAKEGLEYAAYNEQPMFRYNSYFGINTVHYLDLVGLEGPRPLPMGAIVASSLSTIALLGKARPLAEGPSILSPFVRGIIDALGSLNFLSWIAADGFPMIAPVVQARSAGASRIAFTRGPWRADIEAIPEGAMVGVFSMNLGMESFFARGRMTHRVGGGIVAVDLDYLYNSAPPCHGQVYPPVAIGATTEF